MRYTGGYGAYRGKSSFHTFLKVLIALLLVVLILLVAGFFLLEKYMVYDADGARLDVPFFHREAAPSPGADTPLVIESAAPTPTPAPQALRAVTLPLTAIADGSAAAQTAAAGGTAAIFDLKADDGMLGYVSALPRATALGTSAADPARNAAIEALNAGELYTIARISCFRDNTAPYRQNALAMKTNSGYSWRDQDDLRWLSPTSETARQYLADICAELAGLGFDEILLEHCAYPTAGNLGYLKKGDAYDAAQFGAVMDAFYAQIRQALAPYPAVKLSITTDVETLTAGTNPVSGQAVAGLLQADRLWAVLTPEQWRSCAALLRAAGMTPETALVAVGAQAEGINWAIR